MASSSNTYNSPCAACKYLRRKCLPDCVFSPYFPPEEPQKFINVHKIFGASNVTKLLNELLPHQRDDAVNSLAFEAEARVRDPVYGCVGAIAYLQKQVEGLQKELEAANADLIRYAYSEIHAAAYAPTPQPVNGISMNARTMSSVELITNARRVSNCEIGGADFFGSPSHFTFPYDPNLWRQNPNGSKGEGNI